jgi:hypothetical protein
MSRNVVRVVVAFAVLVGGSMIVGGSSAEAGHCGGGLFTKLKAARTSCCAPAPAPVVECCPPVEQSCGGGLFAKLRSKLAARKASCCAPEPVCCEPAPAPCCEPAPAPCCEPAPAPCCGSAPVAEPCCGGASGEVVYGETIISEAPVESASDEVPPAPEAAKE